MLASLFLGGPQGSTEGWNTLRWPLFLFVIHNNNHGPLVAVVKGEILDSWKVVGGLQNKKEVFFCCGADSAANSMCKS
jgi:hypothetical protein